VIAPAAIIPRQRATVVDHNGGLLSLHQGTVIREPRVIELAMAQNVLFDLPETVILARGSVEMTLDNGTTVGVNAGELILKLDDAVARAAIGEERIKSLRVGLLRLTLDAAPKKLGAGPVNNRVGD